MHRTRLTFCALLLLTAGAARAGIDNAGTTAGNFLSVGSGASILSMGGATLGSGTDLHAAAWNPAALGHLGETQFALGHSALAMESAQEWLSAGGRVAHGATRWSVDALYQSEGGFDGRDALNNSTGSFNVSNMALGVRVARPFGNVVLAGLGMHWVNEDLGDAKGSGLGFDAGLQAHSGPFGFGLAARNVGGQMKYAAGSYDLPGVFGAGVSWSHPSTGLRVNLDANFPNAYYNDVRMGAEWRWQDRMALRAGYRKELGAPSDEPLSGPSFGLGVGAGGMWMDYGYLVGGADVQGQHRIGLTFRPSLRAGGMSAIGPRVENAPAVKQSQPVAVAKSAPQGAKPLQMTLPANTTAAPGTLRKSEPAAGALLAGRPVRAPKLIVPKPESEPVAHRGTKQVGAEVAPRAAMTDEVAPANLAPPARVQPVSTRSPQVEIVRPAPIRAPEPAESKVAVPKPAARPNMVVVKTGETLSSLARLYDNSVAALMMENNLVSDQVKPGQKLRLPPAGRH
ncbi:MAG: PorV/PorQ family protein [Candidatus Eisenbacteria bacterium]